MNIEDLNIKYIREKTGLVENDELIPIILEMIQESYKTGLCQAEYDNTMGLVEENQQLKEQLQQKENIINKAKEYIKEIYDEDDNTCYVITKNRKEILLEILDNKGEMKDE